MVGEYFITHIFWHIKNAKNAISCTLCNFYH